MRIGRHSGHFSCLVVLAKARTHTAESLDRGAVKTIFVGVSPRVQLPVRLLKHPPPPTPPRHAARAEGGEKKQSASSGYDATVSWMAGTSPAMTARSRNHRRRPTPPHRFAEGGGKAHVHLPQRRSEAGDARHEAGQDGYHVNRPQGWQASLTPARSPRSGRRRVGPGAPRPQIRRRRRCLPIR
jgi:hypothetical protein